MNAKQESPEFLTTNLSLIHVIAYMIGHRSSSHNFCSMLIKQLTNLRKVRSKNLKFRTDHHYEVASVNWLSITQQMIIYSGWLLKIEASPLAANKKSKLVQPMMINNFSQFLSTLPIFGTNARVIALFPEACCGQQWLPQSPRLENTLRWCLPAVPSCSKSLAIGFAVKTWLSSELPWGVIAKWPAGALNLDTGFICSEISETTELSLNSFQVCCKNWGQL